MRYQGKLTNWNDKKGFGFVEPNGGGDRSFVHIKSFQKLSKRPVDGDLIVYKQTEDEKGRFTAIDIRFASDSKTLPKSVNSKRKIGAIVSVAFCLFLLSSVLLKRIPIEIALFYVIASLITIIVYAVDKSAAERGNRRIPEKHLHLLSLMGGWAGAFYAQNKLRHKSSKKEFQQVHWATVVINLSVFVWFLTQHGQELLGILIG